MNRDFYRVPCGKHLMVNSRIISLFVFKRLFNQNSINSFLLCCDPFFHSAGKLYSSLDVGLPNYSYQSCLWTNLAHLISS
jgi:hypothetical protein